MIPTNPYWLTHRSISATPHFSDISAKTGIDFKNQYYPEFMKQKLAFAMIRYGPAGLSAVDYDSDGFYDLFIPDGVESKLFRNMGDGTGTVSDSFAPSDSTARPPGASAPRERIQSYFFCAI